MKRKTLLSCAAVALSAAMLTACVNTDKHVSFSHYWYQDADIATASAETLTYEVSFKQGSGLSQNYTVDYAGTYTTTLSKSAETGNMRYETNLVVDVTYTLNGESKTLQDTVVSWVEFAADKALTPIASHKEIVNHSPSNSTASTFEECYTEYNYTVDTTYASDGTGGSVTIVNALTEGSSTPTFELEDDLTALDNEQLLLALRGVNPSSYGSPSFYVYAPFTSAVQTVKASFGSKEEGAEFSFKKDGEEEKKSRVVAYYPVTLEIDSSHPGQSQTVWIAATNDSKANTYRNAILRMETPISYNLGTLVYDLVAADFSE